MAPRRDPFSNIPNSDGEHDDLMSTELKVRMVDCASVHRAVNSPAARDPANRRKIMARAAELGCTGMIPDDWKL